MNSLYLMVAPAKFRCKIGVSKNVRYRRQRIDETVTGPVWVVLHRKVFAAYFFEGFLHVLFYLFRRPIKAASGGTEFFSIIILPVAFFAVLLVEFFCLAVVCGIVWGLMAIG